MCRILISCWTFVLLLSLFNCVLWRTATDAGCRTPAANEGERGAALARPFSTSRALGYLLGHSTSRLHKSFCTLRLDEPAAP